MKKTKLPDAWKADIRGFFKLYGDPRDWVGVNNQVIGVYGACFEENTPPFLICEDFGTLCVLLGAAIYAYDELMSEETTEVFN